MALSRNAIRNHHPMGLEKRVLYLRGGTGNVYLYAFVGQRWGSPYLEPMSSRSDLIPRGIALDCITDPGNGDNTEKLPVQAGRISGFSNSAGNDAITASDYGRIVYAVDDNTLARTDGDTGAGPTRSPAGFFTGFDPIAGVDTLEIEVPENFDAVVMRLQGFDVGDATPTQDALVYQARGLVTSNIASLAAFTVAGNDGLTYSQGQIVWLVGQTTAAQNGPYAVGAVAGGTAALTRPAWWNTGDVKAPGVEVHINEGTTWKGYVWYATATGSITVGTTDPAFYPRRQSFTTAAMTGGTVTTSTLWLRSGGSVLYSRAVTGGTVGHVSMGTPTAGAGNGAVTLTSSSGTETSTFTVVVHN